MVVHNESWTDGFFNWRKVVINLAVYTTVTTAINDLKQQWNNTNLLAKCQCLILCVFVVRYAACCLTTKLLYYSRFVVLQPICCFTVHLLFYITVVLLFYSRLYVLQPICCFILQSICCFTADLLFYSRFVVRGTLWVSEETETMSHGFYQSAALDIGEDLRQNTLPGCCYEREAGDDDQSSRGQNSSRTLSSS